MSAEKYWDIETAFADFLYKFSPPTHDHMTTAFRRAGVDSPRENDAGSINKLRRTTAAFEDAASQGEDRVEALIKALTSQMVREGVFQSRNAAELSALEDLRRALAGAGWSLSTDGKLQRLGVVEVHTGGRDALEQQLERVRGASGDIALTIGASKDALEAAAKYIIEEHGETYTKDESIDALFNRALKLLGISTKPIVKDSDAANGIALINQCMASTAKAVRLIRNDQGTGHGRTAVASLGSHEAALLSNQVQIIINYILVVHDSRTP